MSLALRLRPLKIIFLVGVASALLCPSSPAFACRIEAEPSDLVSERAHAVVLATISEVPSNVSLDQWTVKAKVQSTLWGKIAQDDIEFGFVADCEFAGPPRIGAQRVIYLRKWEGKLFGRTWAPSWVLRSGDPRTRKLGSLLR